MSYLPNHIDKEGLIGAPEEEGIVVEAVRDIARVKITKGSLCSSCGSAESCPFNALGKKDWIVWAKNNFDAKEGDRVKISISAGRYLAIAVLIFIMPVSVLLSTYIIARLLGAVDNLAVALSITFAFLSYFIVRGVDRGSKGKTGYEIVEIIEKGEK